MTIGACQLKNGALSCTENSVCVTLPQRPRKAKDSIRLVSELKVLAESLPRPAFDTSAHWSYLIELLFAPGCLRWFRRRGLETTFGTLYRRLELRKVTPLIKATLFTERDIVETICC